MKKDFFTLLLCTCITAVCHSQTVPDTIIVHESDLSRMYYLTNEVDSFTHNDKTLRIHGSRTNATFDISEVDSVTFKDLQLCPNDHHPHLINLGLSDGSRWACCNVGATAPEHYGNYYSWGETEEKDEYTYQNYKYRSGNTFMSLNIGGNSSFDAARKYWGGGWRIPTITEIERLVAQCKVRRYTHCGVKGLLLTGPNKKSIFLPFAGRYQNSTMQNEGSSGYYWSSSEVLANYYGESVYILYVGGTIARSNYANSKIDGLPIRPVYGW